MGNEHVKEILRMLNNVGEITKGDKPTAQGLAVLADMLSKEYNAAQVAQAIRSHLNESPFFPVFSDIAKQLRNTQGEAWNAWQGILNHIARHGYMSPPSGLDSVTETALACVGGYKHLCTMPSDQINIAASQFCRAYEALEKRESYQKILPHHSAGKAIDVGVVNSQGIDIAKNLFKFPEP